ncbi:insulinase family protein [bacterium]|nr:insulinase family protein [candidate division CSSED10-310 bacterium]
MARKGCLRLFMALLSLACAVTQGAVRTHYLANGMPCHLAQDHTAPLVALITVVHCGSAYESPDQVGLTHLLEHLLFDGTENRSQQQLQDAVDGLGGYFNAFTRKEYTLFMIVVPAASLETAAEIQNDMLFHSVITEEQLDKERKVVLEELARDRDRPGNGYADLSDRLLFRGTAYAHPVTGEPAVVRAIPRADLEKFYREFYQPANAFTVLVGDFENDAALEILARHHGAEPPGATPQRALPMIGAWPEGSVMVRRVPLESPRLKLFFPVPETGDPGVPLMDVVVEVLGGNGGVLHRLAAADPDISDLDAWVVRYRHAAYLEIAATLTGPLHDAAAARIVEQLNEVRTGGFNEDDVAAALTRMRVDPLFDGERFDHRAWDYAAAAVAGDVRTRDRLPDVLDRITIGSLASVSARYLDPARMMRLDLLPEEAVVEQSPQREIKTGGLTLANGLRLITRENLYRDLTAVTVLIGGRSMGEGPGEAGLGDVVARLLEKTTPRRGGSFDEILAAHGMRLQVTDDPYLPFDDYYFSRDYLTIRLEMPGVETALGLDLVADMLRATRFSQDAFDQVREEALAVLRMIADKASVRAEQVMQQCLFPGSAFAHAIRGTGESLRAMTLTQAIQYHARVFQPGNTVIAVVGACAPAVVEEAVRSRLDDWRGSAGMPTSVPSAQVATAEPVFEILAGTQATIRLTRPLPLHSLRDEASALVLAQLLTNQLVAEIRERHGLAYSLGAGMEFTSGGPLLHISVTTRSENRPQVMAMISAVVADFSRRGIQRKDLERASNTVLGRRLRYRQRRINQAHFLALAELMGRGAGADDEVTAAVSRLEPADVRELAALISDLTGYATVVAGPE